MEIKITVDIFEDIFLAHRTLLPRDVVDGVYEEFSDIFDEIIANAQDCTEDHNRQMKFIYSTLERMMILDGIYITEPAVY